MSRGPEKRLGQLPVCQRLAQRTCRVVEVRKGILTVQAVEARDREDGERRACQQDHRSKRQPASRGASVGETDRRVRLARSDQSETPTLTLPERLKRSPGTKAPLAWADGPGERGRELASPGARLSVQTHFRQMGSRRTSSARRKAIASAP